MNVNRKYGMVPNEKFDRVYLKVRFKTLKL